MANRNYANSRLYSGHIMPVLIDCSFQVASSDSAGLGIINLKGPYVKNVFMHTSSTPAGGNPNPASGTIVVQLQDNYSYLYDMEAAFVAPNSGTPVKIDNSAMTSGVAYTISVLGNASLAKWQAIGVPVGITPAVGVSFIAASNGGAGNTLTSRVQASAAAGSGVGKIEMLGNPQLLLAPNPSANQSYGASIILQCRDFSGAAVAPADGSVISLRFLLSNSSISINGY